MAKKAAGTSINKIDFEPDAWKRFERAVKVVANSPPQPKVKNKPVKRKRKERL